MRNAGKLLPIVSGIMQAISVDDLMFGIGEEWEVQLSFAVGGDLLCKFFANVWRIQADRVERDVLILPEQCA